MTATTVVEIPSLADLGDDHPILRQAILWLCAYEAISLATRRPPTLSQLMWWLPRPVRALVWGGVAAGLTDHFLTRRWL